MTYKSRLKIVQVIINGAVWYIIYDLLLVCHCKLYLVPFLSYFMLNYIMTLKSGLGYWKWYHYLGIVSYSYSVTMALSCIISDTSEILVENRDFLIPLAFDAPVRGSRSKYCCKVRNYNGLAIWRWKKFVDMFFRHNTGVWRTDEQADRHIATA